MVESLQDQLEQVSKSLAMGASAALPGPLQVYLDNAAEALAKVSAQLQLFWGTGTPQGAVVANVGALFLRTDGGAATTLYVKEAGAGNLGWVAK